MTAQTPTERIAVALERIADVLEEQFELTKIMQLDAASVLKRAANDAQESGS